MVVRTEVVAANLILDDLGRVLLVREAKPESLGRWSLPAGRVERGESLRQAARREALEETGLDVSVHDLIKICHAPTTLEGGSAIVFVYRSAVVGGAVAVTADHPEVEWFTRDHMSRLIDDRMIRGQHVAEALDAVDAGVTVPDDVVVEVSASLPPR